jgi:hypothetical protein
LPNGFPTPDIVESTAMGSASSRAQCAALWREYAAATYEHVRLLTECAVPSGTDVSDFQALVSQAESAAKRRREARAAVKLHLATAHPPREAAAQAFGSD